MNSNPYTPLKKTTTEPSQPPKTTENTPEQFSNQDHVPKRVAAIEKRQALKLTHNTALIGIGGMLATTAGAIFSATISTVIALGGSCLLAYFLWRAKAETQRLELAYNINPNTK